MSDVLDWEGYEGEQAGGLFVFLTAAGSYRVAVLLCREWMLKSFLKDFRQALTTQ